MDIEHKDLDSLARGQSNILVFDCEFWHVMEEGNYIYLEDKDFFFVPREFGGFMITKKKDTWKYNNDFFITLTAPKKDVVIPISHYSTVTPQTGWKLDEIEQEIGVPWGESFPSTLDKDQKGLHKKAMKLYTDDENIKEHHKASKAWYKKFIKIYSESTIVVKGKGDIEAIQNACMIYEVEYKEPKEIVDIALWNQTSYKLCKTAKLEGTYMCVKSRFDKDLKAIEKLLPLDKAHDPRTDASMTFLLALYIEGFTKTGGRFR
jgi:hypothetical protein